MFHEEATAFGVIILMVKNETFVRETVLQITKGLYKIESRHNYKTEVSMILLMRSR